MSDYKQLATEIIELVGGSSNIHSVVHCMTRLRFKLKDLKKADAEKIKNLDGVQQVIIQGGQFQVVIGADVSKVFTEITKMEIQGAGESADDDSDGEEGGEKESILDRVLGTITDIFQPIIPVISGSGMIKALLAILTVFNLVDTEGSTYILLSTFADAAFYFLPILLAVTSAKRFKANPFIAAAIVSVLIHPNFTGLVAGEEAITFIGLPVRAIGYGAAVIPPILIVWMQAYIEKLANKITPNTVKVFMFPMITILLTAPLGLIVFGPLGAIIGDGLYYVFEFFNNEARWVIPVLIGTFTPLFVMTGMHLSFMPIQLTQYATLGYGTLLGPGMLASNISQAGASFAVALRTKDKKMRALATSSGTTALFGVSEPALYGVTMKLKRPLLMVMISGGIAGLWGGLTNMRTYASSVAGITALPVYITDDLSNVINAVICIIIAFIASFILTFFFGMPKEGSEQTSEYEPKASETNMTNAESYQVNSPLSGQITDITTINDEVFSKNIMGKGVAIQPNDPTVYAPFNGEVKVVFPTKHAIGLQSDDGVELMIHVGIDTVELEGKYFESYVKENQKVVTGDKLLSFDLDKITAEGYEIVTPIIITNSDQYADIIFEPVGKVANGQPLVKIINKED
ncbi:beta-glucoside-specific PTS transporter subunit IIABC [Amphibacillus sp. MSJ-3]|uniref:beta-glucoside-specific PTS transporter subunit IIABC n=1 Tax=Amphibacillus sp. MSJ-3 TaxID=2841505 RepID=UPI001C0F28FB|nr:beta-glucoside-specific PTS transporter subunit IIABC [Amphibacillus sp. MSJ-3]MBU5594475.1 beta-glucoside-specific PTS transporter subunit IIABC [Amphibacillus sp. MSJ-3]